MPKRLVMCCDGTWNTPDQASDRQPCPTNVTKVALSVAPTDGQGIRQCLYYHPGVGTGRWDHFRGGAFGVGLSANVIDTYRFLVENYEPGDELFFFGFSRGAFTARSTVGMVRNSGILRRTNADRIEEAYALYRSREAHPRGVAATLFRRSYSHEPRIRFIGVWDTVGSLGIPNLGFGLSRLFNRRWQFHDTALSSHVDAAFQALAIDEKRRPFAPAVWQPQPEAVNQVVEQIWFTGVHCDVGGGYPDTSLSDLALLWLAEKARACGLAFAPGAFPADGREAAAPGTSVDFTVNPEPLGRLHNSRTKFYRLIRPYSRPIGTTDPADESAASTAALRYDKDPEYRPANLAAYLGSARPPAVQPVGP